MTHAIPSDPLYQRLVTMSRSLTQLLDHAVFSHPLGSARATFSIERTVVRLHPARHDPEVFRRAIAGFATRYRPDEIIRHGRRDLHERWYLLSAEPGAPRLYLHRHLNDDPGDRGLHDHPWYSASMLLTGTLVEEWRADGSATEASRDVIEPCQVIVRPPQLAHRLTIGDGQPATLVATGAHVRQWGFWQRDGQGFPAWTYWRHALHPPPPWGNSRP